MSEIKGSSLVGVFAEIGDPRCARGIRHKLEDIIVISVLAFICGADDYVDVHEYGLANESWLAGFLSLDHGIPSTDTFERVFAILDHEQWQACFRRWTRDTVLGEADKDNDEILAIDGKTSRRSHDKVNGLDALHTVSVWSSYGGIVLAQEQVPDKTNEITVIPEIVAAVNPAGAVVTTDALGTQKEIADTIREYQADYLLALKENHPKLFEDVKWLFQDADQANWQGLESSYTRTEETSRDRHELRECWVLSDLSVLETEAWRDLNSVVRVRAQRTHKGETASEDRFYISSLPCDASRARKANSQANLVTLRHIALNILKQDKTSKVGIKAKRKRAGWDRAFLLHLLSFL